MSEGPWFVWDDSFTPLAKGISYEEMYKLVDLYHLNGQYEIYGENNVSGGTYPEEM